VRARLLFVAVATLFIAAGCGHGTHAAISTYLTRVQRLETDMAGALQQVSTANQAFARSQQKLAPARMRDLATSERTLRTLKQRIALVKPPEEAKHLSAMLVQLVGQEVVLAREVRQLALFLPRYQAALRPLQPASSALKAQLSATAKGKAATKALDVAKADQLAAFARTLDSVIAAIRPLDPPPVWQPTYAQQLASLTQMRGSALALAAAVRANNGAVIPRLLERFDAAAVSNQSVASQKREIAAVKAYNARINAVYRLAQRVQRERTRLEKRYK
jgi:hypothetical protein